MVDSSVRIVWWKPGCVSPHKPLAEQITDEQRQQLIDAATHSEHDCLRIGDGVVVETASKWWTKHFRLFVYLPKQHLLLRLCNDGSWYIDVGILWVLTEEVCIWTDLELDVTTSGSEPRYKVLDIDEFADAVSAGEISTEMAVMALHSLHDVVQDIEAGRFPPLPVRELISSRKRESSYQ